MATRPDVRSILELAIGREEDAHRFYSQAAQRVFAHRAQMNGLASKGQWKQDLEKKAA